MSTPGNLCRQKGGDFFDFEPLATERRLCLTFLLPPDAWELFMIFCHVLQHFPDVFFSFQEHSVELGRLSFCLFSRCYSFLFLGRAVAAQTKQ